MASVQVSPEADSDTDAIIRYLATEAGKRTAVKYVGLLEALYDRLSEFPDSGAPRPALGARMRIGIVSPFIVIYEHDPDRDVVTVLRIVHGNQRISAKLLSRG
jgi:toxin ParE1/3/4